MHCYEVYTIIAKWFVTERMVQGFYGLCQYGGISHFPLQIQKRVHRGFGNEIMPFWHMATFES